MSPRPGDGALDLRAVRRDDEILDALGRRGPGDAGDPATLLLAALAADIDEGLAGVLATPLPDAPAGDAAGGSAAVPGTGLTDGGEPASAGARADHTPAPTGGRRRRRTAVGAAAALALGATFSVSGVAAAVTGDPFAPYRAVGGAFSWGNDDLPPNAADVAQFNKRLAGARAAIAHGDVAGVQARIDALRAALPSLDLTDGQRAALERKLDRLEAAAARATTERKNVPGGPPSGKGPQGNGKGTGEKATGEKAGAGAPATGKRAGGEEAGDTQEGSSSDGTKGQLKPAPEKTPKGKPAQEKTPPGKAAQQESTTDEPTSTGPTSTETQQDSAQKKNGAGGKQG